MNQAWTKSGASIDTTLRQAAEIQARAFHDWQEGESAERRAAAYTEWLRTSTLIASIHGKLNINVQGSITHNHVILTPQLQTNLVASRRRLQEEGILHGGAS